MADFTPYCRSNFALNRPQHAKQAENILNSLIWDSKASIAGSKNILGHLKNANPFSPANIKNKNELRRLVLHSTYEDRPDPPPPICTTDLLKNEGNEKGEEFSGSNYPSPIFNLLQSVVAPEAGTNSGE